MRKIPQLDGIRGIAILFVLATHYLAYEPWSLVDRLTIKISGAGWMGVDLFFVLSGFLITGILFDTKRCGDYLATFFKRRALRIFPLYFIFLLGLLIACYWIIPHWPQAAQWRESQTWYWLYMVNFMLANEGSWAAAPFNSGHLWSLAIEEQFYLLWPFVVWKLGRRHLMSLCVIMFAGVFILRISLSFNDFNSLAVFVATPTRMDTLLAGAFVALLIRGPSSQLVLWRLARAGFIVGSAILAAVIISERGASQYSLFMQTVGYSAIAAMAASLVLAAVNINLPSSITNFLSANWLTFFGTYSYALYMFHGLAGAAVETVFPQIDSLPTVGGIVLPWVLLRASCSTALAVVIALISWHLLEKRFLSLKPKYKPAPPEVALLTNQPA